MERVVRVISSAELSAAGNRFARMLDAVGAAPCGGVAVLAGNIPEFLAAYRGATWSGRRFTPMSWRWSAEEIAYVVDNCEAEVLVVEARYADLAEAAAVASVPPERRFAVGGDISGFRSWGEVEALAVNPRDAALGLERLRGQAGLTGEPAGRRIQLGAAQRLQDIAGEEHTRPGPSGEPTRDQGFGALGQGLSHLVGAAALP